MTEKTTIPVDVLEEIISDAESTYYGSSNSRLAAERFTLYILVGADGETEKQMMRQVKELYRDSRACAFLPAQPGMDILRETENILRRVAESGLGIRDLVNINLCPVVLDTSLGQRLPQLAESVRECMRLLGKQPVWHPFLLLDLQIQQYAGIARSILAMQDFVSTLGRENTLRCCVLSNTDARGHAVPREQLLKTIVTMTLLCAATSFREAISIDGEQDQWLFYTARCVTLANPVRSATCQKLLLALDHFSGSGGSANTMESLQTNFASDILTPYFQHLPGDGTRVSTLPIYGVMDGEDVEERLKEFCARAYLEPVLGKSVRAKQMQEVERAFLHRFFQAGGTLRELEAVLRDGRWYSTLKNMHFDITNSYPIDMVKCRDMRGISPIYKKVEQAVVDKLLCANSSLVQEYIEAPETIPSLLAKVRNVLDYIELLQQMLRERRDIYRTIEILFDPITENQLQFLEDPSSKKAQESFYRAAQRMMMEETTSPELLRICYEATRNSLSDSGAYMESVNDACRKNSLPFLQNIESNWEFPLQVVWPQNAGHVLWMLASQQNELCKALRQKEPSIAVEPFDADERIEIVRLSGAFGVTDILQWKSFQESAQREGEMP